MGGAKEWAEQPALAETYWYPTTPRPSEQLAPEAAALLSGQLRPANRFPRQELGFPPPWGANPFDDDNWLSNLHGLEGIGSLLAAGITFPMFREAEGWTEAAFGRLEQWLKDNLSPEGFHLEQSPAYHWFVLLRLAAIDRFLRANRRQVSYLVKSPREAHLVAPEGARCVVEQSAAGEWQVVRGQEKPLLQGWYSAGYGEWEASATLVFRPSAETLELESRVRLEPAPSEELSH